MNPFEDQADKPANNPDVEKNPGVETVGVNLNSQFPQFNRAVYDESGDGAGLSVEKQAEVEKVLFSQEDAEEVFGRKEATDAFLADLHGTAPYLQNEQAAQLQQDGVDDWRAREIRNQSLMLAARNHQGRGIPVEDLIDEAKTIATYLETGDVPDYSY